MTLTPGTTAPTAAPPTPPIAASWATRGLLAHAPRVTVVASVSARIDLCIALSPVQLSCRTMSRASASADGAACHEGWNDDVDASFRRRDNSALRNERIAVKCLFNLLNQRQDRPAP